MRALHRLLVAVLILTFVAPVSTSAAYQGVIGFPPEPPEGGNPYVRGIASHAWWLDPEVYGDQLLPALDDLDVTTVRLSIDWRRFEPVEGQYDWSMYDRVLNELARRNVVIIANFNTIPAWASVNEAGCADSRTEPQTCELREDKYPQFEQAIEAAVSRYSWIEHWEFWNEPEMWPHLGQDGPTYLRHLRIFYDIAHRINPEIVVAAQTLVGAEYMEYIYNLSEEAYGDGNEPWDAISIHPYNFDYVPETGKPPLEINYDRVRGLRSLMVERGDSDEKIWITEYGWNHAGEYQARNLPAALDWMRAQPYIAFAHLHMLHDWNEVPHDQFGLMEIVPNEEGRRVLTPETRFRPKELYYNAFKNYPIDQHGWRPTGANVVAFPSTGHTVAGPFLSALTARGGTEILGHPLTRPYTHRLSGDSWRLVQDFERGRLVYRPEYAGTEDAVVGAPVGQEIAARRADEPPFRSLDSCDPAPDRRCFEETGQSLSAGFLEFWEASGGERVFGLPVSEEFVENGRTVQYFERARLEWYPERSVIVTGDLVREQLVSGGWLNPDGTVPPDPRLPTRPEFR